MVENRVPGRPALQHRRSLCLASSCRSPAVASNSRHRYASVGVRHQGRWGELQSLISLSASCGEVYTCVHSILTVFLSLQFLLYDLYVEISRVCLHRKGEWPIEGQVLNFIANLTFGWEILSYFAARMIRETGADYKKAIVAVAIASGVGATVAGAGLLAYRLWRRSRSVSDIKSDRPSAPLHTVRKSRLIYNVKVSECVHCWQEEETRMGNFCLHG